MIQTATRRLYLPSSGETDPYPWFPSFDRNTAEAHVGSGGYGVQRTMAAPAAPVTTRQVSVSTWSAFASEMVIPETQITVTASISNASGGQLISGDITDVDVILNPGVVLGVTGQLFVPGYFDGGDTLQRLRFRGPTIGVHSGGQLHNFAPNGLSNSDIILDGIDLTGDSGQQAILTGVVNRMAVVYCRGASGKSFYGYDAVDLFVGGCSMLTGLSPPPGDPADDPAWGWRCQGAGWQVFVNNDFRGDRYPRLRVHPFNTSTLFYGADNVLVDLDEGSIFTCTDTGASGSNPNIAGVWMLRNQVYALGPFPRFFSERANYVRFLDNDFFGDITSVSITNATDQLADGNTFTAGTPTPPAWGGPGTPAGLDWEP